MLGWRKELESKLLPIAKLFSQDFFFRVPEYQRPFLWDNEDFSNLIDDLMGASWEEPYFLGTLVLHRQNGAEFDIVDGQQRLTALCILIACIRDALLNAKEVKLATELTRKFTKLRTPLKVYRPGIVCRLETRRSSTL